MLDTAKYSFKKYHGQIRLITKTNKIDHAFAWFIAVHCGQSEPDSIFCKHTFPLLSYYYYFGPPAVLLCWYCEMLLLALPLVDCYFKILLLSQSPLATLRQRWYHNMMLLAAGWLLISSYFFAVTLTTRYAVQCWYCEMSPLPQGDCYF